MQNTNFTRCIFLICLILSPLQAFAQTGKLNEHDIKEILSGASIQLDTPFGTTIPISFGNDGIISGKAGRLATYLGSSEDRGRWWVSKNKLCFKWFKWLNSEPQCLSLELNDHHISWVLDDGMKGTAILDERPRDDKQYILKSAPQLAQRTTTSLKKQFSKSDKNNHKSIFSVGIHLSQALRSDRNNSSTEPSLIKTSSTETFVSSKKTLSQTSIELKNETANSSLNEKNTENSTSSKIDLVKANDQSLNSTVQYLAVAGLENGDTLNIRSGPSLEQSIIGEIPPNSINIKLVGPCMNFWCKVNYKNIYGWVNRYYLAESNPVQRANYN